MPLNFVKQDVNPGEPITAQAWNAIVDGLFDVQSVLLTGSGSVRVTVTGNQPDIDAARVVATDAGGVRYESVPPSHAGDPFVFSRLTAGAYTIQVTAPGCTDATATVTVNTDGSATPNPVPVALAFTGQRMPAVLGSKWKDAVASLQPLAPTALDASGAGVALTGFSADVGDLPIIVQWPDAGEIVPVGKTPFVCIAAPIKAPTVVTTPNLIGLPVTKAQATLASLGLQLKVV